MLRRRQPRDRTTAAALAVAALAVGTAACSKPEGAPPPGTMTAATAPPATAIVSASPSASAQDEAKQIFDRRCVMCHGTSGKGDGPSAVTLQPRPRDFTDRAWQKAATDAQIETAIVKGGPAVGKSPLMPPNPDLTDRPEVVRDLAGIVRGLGS